MIGHQAFVSTRRRKKKCRGPDSNRHGRYRPTDFKSVVSTIPPPRRCIYVKYLYDCLSLNDASILRDFSCQWSRSGPRTVSVAVHFTQGSGESLPTACLACVDTHPLLYCAQRPLPAL